MDNIPKEVAVTLLTSPQSKTNSFRKRCLRAMERICEPQSRSTWLNVSAPRTGEQKLQARLSKANAAQLHRWGKRTLRRGERLQDARDKVSFTNDSDEAKALVEVLDRQIDAHDRLCEAIQAELDKRWCRGKVVEV